MCIANRFSVICNLYKKKIESELHCKKNKIFSEPTKKGSVDAKSFQMSSNVERNNKKILRNLKRFFTWIHSRNLIHKTFLSFVQNLKRLLTKPSGSVFSLRNRTVCSFFLRNLFRRCTKLKKVLWIRLRECIQVKNLFRFRRIFLLFLSTFELIWKLFASTEPFLVGSEKILFFLQCINHLADVEMEIRTNSHSNCTEFYNYLLNNEEWLKRIFLGRKI